MGSSSHIASITVLRKTILTYIQETHPVEVSVSICTVPITISRKELVSSTAMLAAAYHL